MVFVILCPFCRPCGYVPVMLAGGCKEAIFYIVMLRSQFQTSALFVTNYKCVESSCPLTNRTILYSSSFSKGVVDARRTIRSVLISIQRGMVFSGD